jgi:hypothetical protein
MGQKQHESRKSKMNPSMRNLKNESDSGDYQDAEPMSHGEAISRNAVQLYVNNKLSPDQELRFEEHYFECPECAEAVAAQQDRLSAAAAASPQTWWRRFSFAVLVPVSAALLALATFQNVVTLPSLRTQLAQLTAPQANTVIVAHQVLLGSPLGETIKTPSVSVEMKLPDDVSSPYYRVEFVSEAKRSLSQVVPAPDGQRLSLHIPSQTLGHGSFNVTVYGLATQESKPGPPIGQYHFNIQ